MRYDILTKSDTVKLRIDSNFKSHDRKNKPTNKPGNIYINNKKYILNTFTFIPLMK